MICEERRILQEKKMQSHVENVLSDFATKTRMPDKECENASLVAQRYLALHTRMGSQKVAYVFVAADYDLMQLRSPADAFAKMNVDIPTFIYVTEKGYGPIYHDAWLTKHPLFHEFRNEVLAAYDTKPEAWQRPFKKDMWKDVASFLALNYVDTAQFKPIMVELWGKDVDPLIKDMRAFVGRHERADLGMEMGKMISALSFSPKDDLFVSTRGRERPLLPAAVLPKEEEQKPFTISLRIPTATPSLPPGDVESFRKRAGLAPNTEHTRVLKQMLLSAMGTRKRDPVNGALLTRYQTEIPELTPEEVSVALDGLNAFPKVHKLDVNASEQCKKVAMSLHKEEWNAVQLLQAVISRGSGDKVLEQFIVDL